MQASGFDYYYFRFHSSWAYLAYFRIFRSRIAHIISGLLA